MTDTQHVVLLGNGPYLAAIADALEVSSVAVRRGLAAADRMARASAWRACLAVSPSCGLEEDCIEEWSVAAFADRTAAETDSRVVATVVSYAEADGGDLLDWFRGMPVLHCRSNPVIDLCRRDLVPPEPAVAAVAVRDDLRWDARLRDHGDILSLPEELWRSRPAAASASVTDFLCLPWRSVIVPRLPPLPRFAVAALRKFDYSRHPDVAGHVAAGLSLCVP